MTVHSSGDQFDTILERLRAEQPLEDDAAQKAVLHHETGLLEEVRGERAAALVEHQAAFDAYPEFREPIEAMLRLRRSDPDDAELGLLFDRLIEVAVTPEQSARALWELAAYRQQVQQDVEGALDCLQSAVETSPHDAACWLELELLAARQEDGHSQMRALEARTELTADPTWQGLLLIELARLCADHADLERASSLLDTVVASEGRAKFASRIALEAIAIRSEEPEMWAHALEGQAELIAQALDDPELGETAGVPKFMCRPECAADAWLRAGELRRRSGDSWGAVAALAGAAERLGDNALVGRLRMAAAEAAGDHDAALTMAREQLAAGASGPWASALWLRVGLAAQSEGDLEGSLEAYGKALEQDASNAAALTLRMDALASGEDARGLAQSVEASAAQAATDETRARTMLVAAEVWACRVGETEPAKAALARAQELGASPELLGRVARSLAALAGDRSWYEEATAELVKTCTHPAERGSLWFEIARSRLRQGNTAGAIEAFGMLGRGLSEEDPPDEGATWLGRCLAAYAVGLGGGEAAADGPSRSTVIQRVAEAESDAGLSRGLTAVAALVAARSGESEQAISLLQHEHEREPGDVVLTLFLADLLRREERGEAAAEVLTACAAESSDPDLAGGLQLEAAFLLWHAGDRKRAIPAFEEALAQAPLAAGQALAWALRCADPDDLLARQRAIELAEEAGATPAASALERFGLGLAAKDGDVDAQAALERLEELGPGGDMGAAAALARVLWSVESTERSFVEVALEQLEELGGAARAIAAAERYRFARFEERDALGALRAAAAWAGADLSLPSALEWLGTAMTADDRTAETDARRAVASQLAGAAGAAALASSVATALIDQPSLPQPFLDRATEVGRLMNLELALPGGDPQRRATALRELGDLLGAEAAVKANALAAWSDLARGAYAEAQEAFRAMVEERPDDLTAWEGLRDAAEKQGNHLDAGMASARLGSLCKDDARAAELWEQAGLTLLEHTDAKDDAEIAFERSLERDPTRFVAFDKLFRRVRARNEDDRQLQLIAHRLQVTEDEAEITKMYWERARVLRRKGDQDGALQALKDVTMLEPDHVGALALAGEIHITRGDFVEAAPLLARLSVQEEAPRQQRLVSGVAAADLFEKKLNEPARSLEVLSGLHHAGLSTPPVRERLARTAARVGNWEEATAILEQLMEERDTEEGRAEAARLAMAIYRDKLREPNRAARAVGRLVTEIPDDAEAIHLLLSGHLPEDLRASAVTVAHRTLLKKVTQDPFDVDRVQLLAEIAAAEDRPADSRAALGCLVALGKDVKTNRATLTALAARTAQVPQMVLDDAAILEIADREDSGPWAELFAALAQTISNALGPSLRSEGVGRKQRIDDSAHPIRSDVARWMATLGFGADFQLYQGGRDAKAIKGVADSEPTLVIGSDIQGPLGESGRAAVAREVFALRRGTTAVLHYDDHTIASIGIAASIEAGVKMKEPPFAVYPEVSRAIRKALSRKVRKAIAPVCERVQKSGLDPNTWARAAQRSIDRMALIASGDASVVIDNMVGPPDSPARKALASNDRAKRLLAFALSPDYLALREKLGMGIE